VPNLPENLERTNSQVFIVFFFGVGLVVLKVEIDGLRNFHGVPPVFGVVGVKPPGWIIHHYTHRMQGWMYRNSIN